MSVQTNVFENGQWVTRTLDPYHVRAQNTRREEAKEASSVAAPAKAPSFAVLTRPLVHSSVIKQIIPVRIRHRNKYDVLFINTDHVVVKEAFGNYRLKDIAVLDHFDSPIRSCRILGDQREINEGDQYATARKNSKYWEYDGGSFLADRGRQYNEALVVERVLPPHIVVLTLQSNKLVFLCAISGQSEQIRFVYGQHELPVLDSPNEQLCDLIAVDPRSRAMAVAASEGTFCLCSLKSMEVMNEEVQETSELNPIKEERILFLEGTILKMEFLHPSTADEGQIILLFIVNRGEKTRMVWYEWNQENTLRESPLQSTSRSLHHKEQLPLLLIPLTGSPALLLVFKQRITMWRDLLTGSPNSYIQYLEAVTDPQEPGSSAGPMLWTQWARPMRVPGDKEAIYLCREDGVVQFLELYTKTDSIVDSSHQAGRLGINVDTAFAVLDVGSSTTDLLALGGCGSEGGLWRIEPRQDPIYLDSIANWTPLNYFTALRPPNTNGREIDPCKSAVQARQQIFACTGTGKHGAIAELSYGYEISKVIEALPLNDVSIENDVLAIWGFHGFFGDVQRQYEKNERLKDITYFLLAHPAGTTLLHYTWKHDADLDVPKLVVGFPNEVNLDYSASTIFASITSSGSLLQVTTDSIFLVCLPDPDAVMIKMEDEQDDMMDNDGFNPQTEPRSYCFRLPDTQCRILAACMHEYERKSFLLTAVERQGLFYLQLGYLNTEYEIQGEPCPLHSRPSCLHTQYVENSLIVFVTTLDSKVHLFVISALKVVPAVPNAFVFAGQFAICDSIALMTNTQNRLFEHLLVCGLRNGSVQTLRLGLAPSLSLSLCEEIVIGNTSVTVITDAMDKSRAVLHCEGSLISLNYPSSEFSAPATVHNISKPGMQHGRIAAFNQVVHSWLPGSASGLAFGSLVCVDRGEIQVCNVSQSPGLVPRHLQVGASPERLIASNYLERLAVLVNKKTIVREANRSNVMYTQSGERAIQSLIKFVEPSNAANYGLHPHAMDVNQEDDLNENDKLLLDTRKQTEKILGLTEWFPKIGEGQYHILVANTTLKRDNKPAGRVLFFTTERSGRASPRLKFRYRINLQAPARSVAAYPDGKAIVYCTESELCLQSVDETQSEFKLKSPIKATMRAPGRSLTIKEPYIYVSGATESLLVFKYEDNKLKFQYSDPIERSGIDHVHIPEHSLIMASDMSRSVVGLWQPPERRMDNTMAPVFEAILPASITHLERINRPAWYRNPLEEQGSQSIIGSSIDGSITQFEIISKGWRFLRFIQNMAERNGTICPFIGIAPFKRHIEPSTSKPHYMHIRGDILQRVLDRGGGELIREMLGVEPQPGTHRDFDSAQARWDRFRELAAEVVDVDDEAWLGKVVQWIRYRLQSAL